MGYLLMNRERKDDALIVFKFNLQQYPNVANCYDSLAECFMNRNENEQAIKHYKLAYDKIPGDTTATEEFKQFLRDGIERGCRSQKQEFAHKQIILLYDFLTEWFYIRHETLIQNFDRSKSDDNRLLCFTPFRNL